MVIVKNGIYRVVDADQFPEYEAKGYAQAEEQDGGPAKEPAKKPAKE